MVLVTRADLKLTKGKLGAQCGHAVSDCVLKASSKDSRMLDRYLKEGARKIVVSAPHLEGLRRIYGEAAGKRNNILYDEGCRTYRDSPGNSDCGRSWSGKRSDIDSITSSLPLVK